MRGTAWRLLTAAALCAATSRGEAQAARDTAGSGSAARTAMAADRSGGAARFVTGGADSAAANSSVTDSFGSNTPASDTSASATSGSAKSVTGNSPTDSSTADSSAAGPRLSAMGPSFRPDTGGTRPRAIEYSDAYGTRLAIHRYASYAELPLFAAEFALGQRILNGERTGDRASSGTRSAHSAVAGGLGVLFAVNTVTGVWNMVEARHDPAGRTRRNLHALGMLVADAGFLWTASLAGDAHESLGAANRHRNAAIASISVATASTLMMWLWKD